MSRKERNAKLETLARGLSEWGTSEKNRLLEEVRWLEKVRQTIGAAQVEENSSADRLRKLKSTTSSLYGDFKPPAKKSAKDKVEE